MHRTPFTSPYTPNTDSDRRKMLDAIGVNSVDELFRDIPNAHSNPKLNISPPTSEMELRREMEAMGNLNKVPGDFACFLGAGSYRHFIPAIVRQLAGRSEFMTSYTPYQPEVSQGTLQTHYEFQSLVCQLTGMEVANAGMYDCSTSLAEAALMACRITQRSMVVVMDSISPTYLEVLSTYFQGLGIDIELASPDKDLDFGSDAACIIVQQPNFTGYMEDLVSLSHKAKKHGALLVVASDPISLGIFKPPGDYGADIVVSEGQALGIATTFGGPYVGIFACKEKYLRQMPGRIVGKTQDTKGRTGYVLTLQTREQHIRRERATSNICTSVGLIALMSTIYMAALGKQGIKHIAELCYHKAHYAATLIDNIPNYSLPLTGTFFREFVVKCPIPPSEVNRKLIDYKIIGGLDVSDQVQNGMLFCCTEINSKEEINLLASALTEIAD